MVDLPTLVAILISLTSLFYRSTRKSIFFTWITSLVIGVKHLVWGSDFIGLGVFFEASVFVYVLFSVTQGEKLETQKKQIPKIIFAGLLSSLMAALLFLMAKEKGLLLFGETPSEKNKLSDLSEQLLAGNFLTAQALLLLCFIVLIGLGLNLRKETRK